MNDVSSLWAPVVSFWALWIAGVVWWKSSEELEDGKREGIISAEEEDDDEEWERFKLNKWHENSE